MVINFNKIQNKYLLSNTLCWGLRRNFLSNSDFNSWWSSYGVLQVGSRGAIASYATREIYVLGNMYSDALDTFKYVAAGEATSYMQFDGGHYFHTSASGSADGAVTRLSALAMDKNRDVDIFLGDDAGVRRFAISDSSDVTKGAWYSDGKFYTASHMSIGNSTFQSWASNFKTLQVGLGGNLTSRTDNNYLYLSSNTYFNATWKYTSTDLASIYGQAAGIHYFQTAVSGTTNTNISPIANNHSKIFMSVSFFE